jgi:hypothetical protein
MPEDKSFDPDVFMQQTVDNPMDTVIRQCPEGEFPAMIDDFEAAKAFRTFDKKEGDGTFTVFSPPFVIQDEAVKAELERDKVVVYHKGMFVDIGPDGGLDTAKGKNVDIGRLREAVGQNAPGNWGFGQLKGAGPVMVKVVHEPDKADPEKKYARVTKVTRIS